MDNVLTVVLLFKNAYVMNDEFFFFFDSLFLDLKKLFDIKF